MASFLSPSLDSALELRDAFFNILPMDPVVTDGAACEWASWEKLGEKDTLEDLLGGRLAVFHAGKGGHHVAGITKWE